MNSNPFGTHSLNHNIVAMNGMMTGTSPNLTPVAPQPFLQPVSVSPNFLPVSAPVSVPVAPIQAPIQIVTRCFFLLI